MVRIVILIFILFFSINTFSEELNSEEKIIFNFLDFDNDQKISFDELNQSIKLLFQLIDENNDGNISENEIIELKNIIESLT